MLDSPLRGGCVTRRGLVDGAGRACGVERDGAALSGGVGGVVVVAAGDRGRRPVWGVAADGVCVVGSVRGGRSARVGGSFAPATASSVAGRRQSGGDGVRCGVRIHGGVRGGCGTSSACGAAW